MIVIGTALSSSKIKVDGLYVQGSVVIDIGGIELPQAELQIGKKAELCYNPETGELFYEYIDRPLTQDELVQIQRQEIEQLQLMVADLGLMVGGGL